MLRGVVGAAALLLPARGLLLAPKGYSRENVLLLKIASAIAKLEESADVLASAGHRRPKLLYGIESCDVPVFEDMLLAQLGSWGMRVPRESIIISGGKHDTGPEPSMCAEENSGTARLCKEATVMYRAARRAANVEADWLAGLHEDSFLKLDSLEMLANQRALDPVVLSGFGCGQNWTYHKESENGTLPAPKGWGEPPPSCIEVEKYGGLCSSGAFFVSRGALLKMATTPTLEEFVQEHRRASVSNQTDMASSCYFYKNGIKMTVLPHTLLGMQVDSLANYTNDAIKEELTRMGNSKPAWVHVNSPKPHVPSVMRALDSILNTAA